MDELKTCALWLVCIAAIGFGIVSCNQSDWMKESDARGAARNAAEATPHVIRNADGCKVYAFRAGSDYHYFTRCENTTMTARSYTERVGKTDVHKSEEITTENAR